MTKAEMNSWRHCVVGTEEQWLKVGMSGDDYLR